MEFGEFEELLQATRAGRSGSGYPEEITTFDSWLASEPDIQRAESLLGVRLPEKYKTFMMRYGAGEFLFLDLLPVVPSDGRAEDLIEVNGGQFKIENFIAVSPVGTGDWWGFSVTGDACGNTVDFWDHETGQVEYSPLDFLDFVARKGLRVGN